MHHYTDVLGITSNSSWSVLRRWSLVAGPSERALSKSSAPSVGCILAPTPTSLSQAAIAKCYNPKCTQTLSFSKRSHSSSKAQDPWLRKPRTFSTETELANRSHRYDTMLAFAEENTGP